MSNLASPTTSSVVPVTETMSIIMVGTGAEDVPPIHDESMIPAGYELTGEVTDLPIRGQGTIECWWIEKTNG